MSITRRVGRMGQLSAAGAAIARAFTLEPTRKQRVVGHLASLHGLPEKLLQYLDLTEIGQGQETSHERNGEKRMCSVAQVRKLLMHELGLAAYNQFSWISPSAITASIGQVHEAQLIDGRRVAVKVQYPGIRDELSTDLSVLGLAAVPVSMKFGRSKLGEYKDELRQSLEREVSYLEEMRALKAFRPISECCPEIMLPQAIEQLSSDRVLTMSWIPGTTLRELDQLSFDDKEFIVRSLLRLFLYGIFSVGEVHADPHPGNFSLLVDERGIRQLGVYDFGCTKVLTAIEQKTLATLLCSEIPSGKDDLLNLYENLGFDVDLLTPLADKLLLVTNEILAPFHHDGTFPLASWDLSNQISKILGEQRLTFRVAGPANLIHFIRIFTGLIRYALNFGVAINWRTEVSTAREVGIILGANENPGFSLARKDDQQLQFLSSSLCVRVEEHGLTKALLKFKPELTESMYELIPPEVLAVVQRRGIDLSSIIENSRLQRYAPGELFALDEGSKKYRVWLE